MSLPYYEQVIEPIISKYIRDNDFNVEASIKLCEVSDDLGDAGDDDESVEYDDELIKEAGVPFIYPVEKSRKEHFTVGNDEAWEGHVDPEVEATPS